MKQSMYFQRVMAVWMPSVMMFSLLFMVLSCSMDPGTDGFTGSVSPKAETEASAAGREPMYSYPVSFNRVDLFTTVATGITGTVTVQIRNADGSVVVGSTTVWGSSLVKGNAVRNKFTFSPALTLNSGEKYRIYLTRSNLHQASSDYLYWRTSSGGTDPYPKGVMNYYPAWSLDYAFVTYSDGYVDQKQTSVNYGFAVGNNSYLWQEFVPEYIWVVSQ